MVKRIDSGNVRVLLVTHQVKDLFFRGKIEEIGRASGALVAFTDSNAELEAVLKGSMRPVVIFDLETIKGDFNELFGLLSSFNSTSIAYYPHVKKEIAYRARSRGLTYVVPRSALEATLRKCLAGN